MKIAYLKNWCLVFLLLPFTAQSATKSHTAVPQNKNNNRLLWGTVAVVGVAAVVVAGIVIYHNKKAQKEAEYRAQQAATGERDASLQSTLYYEEEKRKFEAERLAAQAAEARVLQEAAEREEKLKKELESVNILSESHEIDLSKLNNMLGLVNLSAKLADTPGPVHGRPYYQIDMDSVYGLYLYCLQTQVGKYNVQGKLLAPLGDTPMPTVTLLRASLEYDFCLTPLEKDLHGTLCTLLFAIGTNPTFRENIRYIHIVKTVIEPGDTGFFSVHIGSQHQQESAQKVLELLYSLKNGLKNSDRVWPLYTVVGDHDSALVCSYAQCPDRARIGSLGKCFEENGYHFKSDFLHDLELVPSLWIDTMV